jgi:hypothetical protein
MLNNLFNNGMGADPKAPLEMVMNLVSDLSGYFLQESMVEWFEFDSDSEDKVHPKIKISPLKIHRIVFEGKSSEYISAQSEGKLITIHTISGEKYTRSIGLTEFLREADKRNLKGLFVQVSKTCALNLLTTEIVANYGKAILIKTACQPKLITIGPAFEKNLKRLQWFADVKMVFPMLRIQI